MTSTAQPTLGQHLARRASAYAALAAMVPKTLLVYNWPVWAQLIQNVVSLVVYVYFWRAVYAGSPTIAGIDLQTTLTYILMARIFRPLANIDLILEFGWRVGGGGF